MDGSAKNKPRTKVGWFPLFLGLPLGNTSVGALLLLAEEGYRTVRYKQHPFRWYLNPIYKYLGLFFVVMVASSLLSTKKDLALVSTLGFFLMVSMVVLGAKDLAKDPKLPALLSILVASSTLSALYAFLYFAKNLSRATAPFVGVNGYGALIVISTSLGIGYLGSRRDRWRYLAVPYAIMMALAAVLTLTRGAWLGYLAMFLVFWSRDKRHLIAILLGICIVAALIFAIPVTHERIKDLGRAFQLRNDIWLATVEMVKENPLLGVGPGVYAYEYPKYRIPNTTEPVAAYAHNIFLQVLAETGVLGFATFFGFLFQVFRAAFYLARRKNFFYQGLLAGLAGILISQQTDNTIVGFEVGGAFWLLVGLTLGFYFLEKQAEGERTTTATSGEAGGFN